jgi:hypothetical protein
MRTDKGKEDYFNLAKTFRQAGTTPRMAWLNYR